MKILVLGSDGRAHALVWKLFANSSSEVICGPGNGGTALLAPQLELDPTAVSETARWAFSEHIDMIVPANSAPLAAGLVDEVVSIQIGVCGPSQRSTRLEWSRLYAKEFLLRYGLPTARGRTFTDLATAEKFLAAHPLPVVLKGDHPEAVGGVYAERYAALEALRALFNLRPLEGRNEGVVIEEYLAGVRVSFSALTDGTTALPLLPTWIYDRLAEQPDSTPAPGMGAHTSTSTYARKLALYLQQQLMLPLVAALERERLPYWGFLGIDCIITAQGPRIDGLRCSLHDQEAQVVLPRLQDDLLPLLEATIARRLERVPPLRWLDEASVAIALVSQGYPHHFAMGGPISGLAEIDAGVLVFHDQTTNPAGLRYTPVARRDGGLLGMLIGSGHSQAMTTTGGHVLSIVALGTTIGGARGRALVNAERISFAGRYYREDIGSREQY